MMEGARRSLNLARRQQCACLIQEIGSRIPTTQVVINAALYYMHHFYEVYSPETMKPILVAIASLYIACKTEDFSRKLSILIGVAYSTLRKEAPKETSDTYKRITQNIHALEATMLMVIGFHRLDVKQPHVVLITVLRENKFSREVSHISYYVCTQMLHFTTLVLRHSMEAIAATSLYIASKWSNTDIKCSDGEWFRLFSPKLTFDEIRLMAEEFLRSYQACDVKIKDHVKNLLKVNKRPFDARTQDPQNVHVSGRGSGQLSNHRNGVNSRNGPIDKRPRAISPQSQGAPHCHSQPTFNSAVRPDSASSYKREDSRGNVPRGGVGGSGTSSRSQTITSSRSSMPKNDLDSVF